MLNFLCGFKACAKFIWPHKYFSNPFLLLTSLHSSLYHFSVWIIPAIAFLLVQCISSFPPPIFFSYSAKYKAVHFIPLLKIPQWFPVAHKMKIRLLIMAYPSFPTTFPSLVYILEILNYLW